MRRHVGYNFVLDLVDEGIAEHFDWYCVENTASACIYDVDSFKMFCQNFSVR
jgi:hypothetical protein